MRTLLHLSLAVGMSLSPLTMTSCHMFSPPVVENNMSEHASYDGNVANSGIVRAEEDGFEVTSNFRTRYNLLVESYGRQVAGNLRQDDGLTKKSNGNWLIDKQHMVYFLDMNQLRKNGATAK